MKSGTRPKRALALLAATVAASLAPSRQSAAVTFNFTPSAATPQNVIDGFRAAGLRWSSLLADDVTVNIAIDFSPIPGGALGTTTSTQASYSYTNTRAAFAADAISADDTTATSFLQPSPAARMLINYTSDSPIAPGSATPYLDDDGGGNNSNVRLHHANAKALGLRSATHDATDGTVRFSSNYAWDFNPYNGVTPGAFDFVGIATHEIGHVLGFSSNVDTLDTNSPGNNGFLAEDDVHAKAMDLFRYSAASVAHGNGVFDMSADARAKYFSIDGGATSLGNFATGRSKGDGQQASHWKDNQNLGLMDPTIPTGQQQFISALDRRMLDVIGWNPNHKWLWMDPAGGNFTSAIRWSSTAVPQAGQEAIWNVGATYAVVFDSPQTTANARVLAGNVTFNLGGTTYTAGGTLDVETATLHISDGTVSAATVDVAGGGTLSVNTGATLHASDAVRVWPGGSVNVNGGVIAAGELHVNGGTISLAPGTQSLKTHGVFINTAAGGMLDLSDNQLIVDYAPGESAIAHVHQLIAAARNYSAWDMPGITTSLAGDDGVRGLACAEASDLLFISGTETAMWAGQTVDASAVLVRFTYEGDVNLDGLFDGADYGTLDNWYQFPGTSGYWNGDVNYDGVIDGADYGTLDNSIQLQGAPFPTLTSAPDASVAAVPEPAACLVATIPVVAALTARRRPPEPHRG